MNEFLDTAKVPLDTLDGSLDTQKEFLDTLGRTTARAYGEDLSDFSRWFKESDGKTLAGGIVTTLDLRDYLSHMLTVRGLKPSTINRRLAAIRAWLQWAKKEGEIKDLPVFPRHLSEPKRAPKSLERVEESRFLRAVAREGNARDSAVIGLMLYAGLRVSEAVSTRPEDIQIGERKGKVVVRNGKGMKRREVPINSDGRGMIGPWLARSKGDYLFPGSGRSHLAPRTVQELIKKYAYQAQLDPGNVTPHVLRHTFATKILRSGVDIVTVAALLGHSRIDTTAIYTQPSWRDLERAVDGQEVGSGA
ncbi:tyrosine-type recombinase/integrase [Desulfosporosinus sp. OT]|uniref:tyrosine-type recombinase/integrase n=1 Tax=Desulfosporosinus sp. OT TaxID=913865 RepID=UPI0002239C90|nr:tyrosine-type recombinase/integrase [Desulfosporosinus sp. OT]EGW40138.1 phage integrase, N-terminal SAM-like domain protein [Desulfosporosinus sp. OT]